MLVATKKEKKENCYDLFILMLFQTSFLSCVKHKRRYFESQWAPFILVFTELHCMEKKVLQNICICNICICFVLTVIKLDSNYLTILKIQTLTVISKSHEIDKNN